VNQVESSEVSAVYAGIDDTLTHTVQRAWIPSDWLPVQYNIVELRRGCWWCLLCLLNSARVSYLFRPSHEYLAIFHDFFNDIIILAQISISFKLDY
jgi:hypothetical protein